MSPTPPLTGLDQPEPVRGPAAGLCGRCAFATLTSFRGPPMALHGWHMPEPWDGGGPTSSVARCLAPTSAFQQVLVEVVKCEAFKGRTFGGSA